MRSFVHCCAKISNCNRERIQPNFQPCFESFTVQSTKHLSSCHRLEQHSFASWLDLSKQNRRQRLWSLCTCWATLVLFQFSKALVRRSRSYETPTFSGSNNAHHRPKDLDLRQQIPSFWHRFIGSHLPILRWWCLLRKVFLSCLWLLPLLSIPRLKVRSLHL